MGICLVSLLVKSRVEFDFRGCSDSSATADTGVNGTGITATAKNGANCSAEGMVFDGSDDYVDVTPWPFGGRR